MNNILIKFDTMLRRDDYYIQLVSVNDPYGDITFHWQYETEFGKQVTNLGYYP